MILDLIRLMRLYYSMPLAGGFIVILSYLRGGSLAVDRATVSFFSLMCIISAGYVFNDICDIEADKINCPQRMLAAGKVKRKQALLWFIFLFCIGAVFGAICGLMFFLAIAAIAFLLIIYNLFSKKMGILKIFFAAALTTSIYPLAFTFSDPASTLRLKVLFVHPLWLFITALGYEMLKDIRDIKGDSQIGEQDFSYRKDKGFIRISRMLIVIGSLITLLPYILGYCKEVYLAASIGAVLLAILSTFFRPLVAIRFIYAEVFLITAGSMFDLMVFGV